MAISGEKKYVNLFNLGAQQDHLSKEVTEDNISFEQMVLKTNEASKLKGNWQYLERKKNYFNILISGAPQDHLSKEVTKVTEDDISFEQMDFKTNEASMLKGNSQFLENKTVFAFQVHNKITCQKKLQKIIFLLSKWSLKPMKPLSLKVIRNS